MATPVRGTNRAPENNPQVVPAPRDGGLSRPDAEAIAVALRAATGAIATNTSTEKGAVAGERETRLLREQRDIPIEFCDGVRPVELRMLGVELVGRGGKLHLPIPVARYGEGRVPIKLEVDAQASHVSIKAGKQPGAYEIHVSDYSKLRYHRVQVFSIDERKVLSAPSTKLVQDVSRDISSPDRAYWMNVDPVNHTDLYNAVVSQEPRGLSASLAADKPGQAAFIVRNALGAELSRCSLPVIQHPKFATASADGKAGRDAAATIQAASLSPALDLPDSILDAATRLRQLGIKIESATTPEGIHQYKLIDGRKDVHGVMELAAVDVDKKSNLPKSLEDTQALVSFLKDVLRRKQ